MKYFPTVVKDPALSLTKLLGEVNARVNPDGDGEAIWYVLEEVKEAPRFGLELK